MKKSDYNKMVIENFILFFTHETREQATDGTEAIDLYEALDNYIEEDHVDGVDGDDEGFPKENTADTGRVISISWSAEDVESRAKTLGVKLSDADIDDVLSLMESKHDASIGINWDVIDEWIHYIKSFPKH